MPKMREDEVKAILMAEKADSLGTTSDANQSSSTLANERMQAMEYYLGTMNDMPSDEGRSKAISSDVSDVVEGLMPPLMEIFTAGDDVMEFEPVDPEDEQAAAQETDYVNHVFMQQNPGFLVLYSMIKDGLLQKTGVAKIWWEKGEIEERETYIGQPDEVYLQLLVEEQEGDIKIIEHSEYPEGSDPDDAGQPEEEDTSLDDRSDAKDAAYD